MSFTSQWGLEKPDSTTQNKTSVYNAGLDRIDEGRRFAAVAAGNLGPYMLTYVTSGRLANLATGATRPFLGFVSSSGSTVSSISSGSALYVQADGHIINSTWAFTPGLAVYAHPSAAGSITQTVPGSLAWPIAWAVSSHQIGILPGGLAQVQSYGPLQTYTVTTADTDRTFDASNTSLNELADVVGTLIGDLRALGIVL